MIRSLALILALGSLPAAAQKEVDAVAEGQQAFETYGCMVCHAVSSQDPSVRSGPNLFGLFLNDPRERSVVPGDGGEPSQVKADKTYYLTSVRKSWDVLAIAERGDLKGKPFPKVMPMYSSEVIPDPAVEYIWHYLRTLAPEGQAGPKVVKLKKQQEARPRNLLEIANEIVVTDRPRVFRAPVRGSSGRALHVGQPNGMNYTFDPRVLSIRNVWAGGFLNLSQERRGRGKPGSTRGHGQQTYVEGLGVLRPLLGDQPVDFEFKEPDVLDHQAIERWLWEERDFPELQASVDAEFLGHKLDLKTGFPTFRFRLGKSTVEQRITLTDDGRLEIRVNGQLKEPLSFAVDAKRLRNLAVEGGELENGRWVLQPVRGASTIATFRANLEGGLVARPAVAQKENWEPQSLVTNTKKLGREPMEVPPGYSSENWEPPLSLYGLPQLFEPTGMAVADDGTLVVVTRSAGIWRLRDGKWTLFAEGIYEGLGVWIEDVRGNQIAVMQKPELTRITDTDRDGRADRFETICDDYGFHGNYHEYAHGPVRDAEGNYYFTLNLSHGGNERTSWRAGGPFMGSMGGYRGWACRVKPDGTFEPYAYGLRSPAGLGVDPKGRVWYAENQGEYVGSSKVVPLEQDKFYGHLSGLEALPGMKPDSPELKFDRWKDKIRKGAVWLPHGKVANSPGHMTWDTTGGKFGPFRNHMFLGDQTMSNLFRVVSDGEQGCVMPFARFTASGVMRPVFLPDGSLLLGQTGRGWGAWGGVEGCLQRIVWDGKTIAAAINYVKVLPQGFLVSFTQPLGKAVTEADLSKKLLVQSWFYTNTGRYGSPEHDRRDDALKPVRISSDRSAALVVPKNFGEGDSWTDRIYHIHIPKTEGLFGSAPVMSSLRAYYTLRRIPK